MGLYTLIHVFTHPKRKGFPIEEISVGFAYWGICFARVVHTDKWMLIGDEFHYFGVVLAVGIALFYGVVKSCLFGRVYKLPSIPKGQRRWE